MKAFMQNLIKRLAAFKASWEIVEVPGMVVFYAGKYRTIQKEIPFTLYVRKGRRHAARTEFRVMEWAEKLVKDRDPQGVEVRLHEETPYRGCTVIRRVDEREIVVTKCNTDTISVAEWLRMGSESLTLKVA